MDTNELRSLLFEFRKSNIKEQCQTCECYQGFLEQLVNDFGETAENTMRQDRVDSSTFHSCLGCKPCPPAEFYTEYLRRKSEESQK